MMTLCCKLVSALEGKTLATAESITAGGIGAAVTQVPGSSKVYAGGIISYTDAVKHRQLGVPEQLLEQLGAVSAPVAEAMAQGVRLRLGADIGLSVTGLAGPGGDSFGNPVGTVYIGCSFADRTLSRTYSNRGDRDSIRSQTIRAALELVLEGLEKDFPSGK